MELPAEVVCHVLSYGANRSWLGQMRRVCQLWRDLIDSTPSLWARFSALELDDTRIAPAALHGLCERIVRVETVRSIHIEGCDQIASAELGIEAIIANCPLLESFTSHTAPISSTPTTYSFLSSNVKKEAKTPYTERVWWGSPFNATLAPERAPLRLFRTYAERPRSPLCGAYLD
ncbi:Fbox domain containing protein [Acanthamoeba castellanii str. Neff]|uniref:Fbox domain containing protein n=1 Tax=Acanthamoeba castellanii (strain ATCC 30010 / Neff) TaxID=1257118 RepID=L8GUZ4_ACACF|nr:Fbox domain containing protein [Acanthamoeba castellanii str. Neff]ELR17004.1 Fbox domain containing protein [Acanthamoeba castellanii str. Neff]